MAELKILDFTVSLSSTEETIADIKSLLGLLDNGIKEDTVIVKPLSGGFINNILKVDYEDKQVIVRVFTDKTESLTRPELSVLSMRAVQLAGLGPDILAWFTNGVVYGYQEGEMVMPDNLELNNPEIRRKIVQKVAAINQIDARSLEIKGITVPKTYLFEEYLDRGLAQLPNDYDGKSFFKCDLTLTASKQSLKNECDWLNKEIRDLDLKNVFCHGDLWWGNVLYDSKRDEINLIDYDLSGYNPFPLDLASILMRNQLSVVPMTMPQLSEEEDKSLCRLYIEQTRKLQNSTKPVTDNEVMVLYGLTKLFKTVRSI